MIRLEYRDVAMRFADATGGSVTAVEGVSFVVGDGEIVALIGPSGCGKSTLLNIGSGLYAPSSGTAFVDSEPVRGPNAHVAFMLQKDLLLPWRTIVENVMLGVEIQRRSREECLRRALELLRSFSLSDFAHHYPHQLSGGMRQRVSIARAFANDPDILLMDEPFSALDEQNKVLLQEELLRIWEESRKTVMFITHSVDEAVLLSSRIVLLRPRPGRIAEVLDVELPHPRWEYDVRERQEFVALRHYLWERIKAMVAADPESEFYGRGVKSSSATGTLD